jgi:hypothetical protein
VSGVPTLLSVKLSGVRLLLGLAFRMFAALVVVGVVATLALAYLPSVGRPSAKAIETSVFDEIGGIDLGSDGCRTVRPRRVWRCDVFDTDTSVMVRYRVEMRGKRCWRARRTGYGRVLPRSAEGCVRLGDQVRPLHRLVD